MTTEPDFVPHAPSSMDHVMTDLELPSVEALQPWHKCLLDRHQYCSDKRNRNLSSPQRKLGSILTLAVWITIQRIPAFAGMTNTQQVWRYLSEQYWDRHLVQRSGRTQATRDWTMDPLTVRGTQ